MELASLREAIDGRNSVQWLSAINTLGNWSEETGDYAAAARFYQSAQPPVEALSGAESAEASINLSKIGLMYRQIGSFQEARAPFERALAIREKLFGEVDARTAWSLRAVAGIDRLTGQSERAEPRFKRVLEVRQIKLGAGAAPTLESLDDLVKIEMQLQHYHEAIPLYEQLADFRSKAIGADDPSIAGILLDLAFACLQGSDLTRELALNLAMQGRHGEAVARADQALAILAKGDPEADGIGDAQAIKGMSYLHAVSRRAKCAGLHRVQRGKIRRRRCPSVVVVATVVWFFQQCPDRPALSRKRRSGFAVPRRTSSFT